MKTNLMVIPQAWARLASLCVLGFAGIPQAEAAIATGAALIEGEGNSNSSGELFLNVWDETAAVSYSMDLGVTVEAFLANPNTGRSWNLDQRFKDFAASGHPLWFNIAGNNSYGGIASPVIGVVPSSWGVITSVLNDPLEIASIQTWNGRAANAPIGAMSGAIRQRLNPLNLSSAAQNGLTPGLLSDMTNFSLNLSETTTGTNDVWASYFDYLWGINSNNKFAVNYTAGLVRQGGSVPDQTVALYFLGLTAPNVNRIQATDLGAGTRFASLDVANARLDWAGGSGSAGPPTKVVPMPAWATALMGIVLSLQLCWRRMRGS